MSEGDLESPAPPEGLTGYCVAVEHPFHGPYHDQEYGSRARRKADQSPPIQRLQSVGSGPRSLKASCVRNLRVVVRCGELADAR